MFLMPRLSLPNLVAGLEMFRGRYHALDVFIEDVPELKRAMSGASSPVLKVESDTSFRYEQGDRGYTIQLYPQLGVARVMRANQSSGVAVGGLVGAGIGAAVSERNEGAKGAAIGMLFGLLVGAVIGQQGGAEAPRRVFTVRFDPEQEQWRAYDGALVGWMKDQLAHPDVLADLPA